VSVCLSVCKSLCGLRQSRRGHPSVCLCLSGGAVLSVSATDESESVACAFADGAVGVWRIEYTMRAGGGPGRYTGFTALRRVRVALLVDRQPGRQTDTTYRQSTAGHEARGVSS
jgi:hypothetical protein